MVDQTGELDGGQKGQGVGPDENRGKMGGDQIGDQTGAGARWRTWDWARQKQGPDGCRDQM